MTLFQKKYTEIYVSMQEFKGKCGHYRTIAQLIRGDEAMGFYVLDGGH